jgi:transcriptional regulator with XRE-family HTH domain
LTTGCTTRSARRFAEGRRAAVPGIGESGGRKRPRTLAEKLQWLRELKTPKGEQPPSFEATARQITETTGVSISGPYFWELATGRTTNPKLHHLQALARFFNVPVGYLSDDDADFEQLESELELLHALKLRGVRNIKLQGTTETRADLATIQGLLGRLQMLDISRDEEVRERLKMLGPSQRNVLKEVISDPDLLAALEDERLRRLPRSAADLADDRLAAVLIAVGQPELLDALQAESVREIALRAFGLSEQSRQAILMMIGHLRQVEEPDQR